MRSVSWWSGMVRESMASLLPRVHAEEVKSEVVVIAAPAVVIRHNPKGECIYSMYVKANQGGFVQLSNRAALLPKGGLTHFDREVDWDPFLSSFDVIEEIRDRFFGPSSRTQPLSTDGTIKVLFKEVSRLAVCIPVFRVRRDQEVPEKLLDETVYSAINFTDALLTKRVGYRGFFARTKRVDLFFAQHKDILEETYENRAIIGKVLDVVSETSEAIHARGYSNRVSEHSQSFFKLVFYMQKPMFGPRLFPQNHFRNTNRFSIH